jgi:hypothetical protein
MSIVTFYVIRCNACAFNFSYQGSKYFASLERGNDAAIQRDWIVVGKKHYCTNAKCLEKATK